jgi:probable HAF family extracellular repeat protein
MMRTSSRIAAVTWCAALTPVLATAQQTLPCRYEIMAIIQGPFCNGSNAPVFARGLSNHDPPWVVGFYTQCTIGPDKAFVWTGGGPVQTIPLPVWSGNPSTVAFGVNDHGQVVGSYYISNGWLGYVYDVPKGVLTPLHPGLPGGGCVARAINNAGMVVGNRTPESTNAFIWQNGVFTDLGFMNGPNSEAMAMSENGIVVGWTGTTSWHPSARGFMHHAGGTTVLPPIPGGLNSALVSIDGKGKAAGYGYLTPTSPRALLYQNSVISVLFPASGFLNSFAYDVSESGLVIGESRTLPNGQNIAAATMWRHGVGSNLNSLIPTASGVVLKAAMAINARGQILCEASHSSGQVAVVLTPVLTPIGDATLDCIVNVNDLLAVINAWGQTGGPADLNQDGIVNHLDLLIVITNWSSAP